MCVSCMRCVCVCECVFRIRITQPWINVFFFVPLCQRTSNVVWVSRYNQLPGIVWQTWYVPVWKKSHRFRSEANFHSDITICTRVQSSIKHIIIYSTDRKYRTTIIIIIWSLYTVGYIFDSNDTSRRWRRRLATVRLLCVFQKRV